MEPRRGNALRIIRVWWQGCRLYLVGYGATLSSIERERHAHTQRGERGEEQITIRSMINKLLAVGSPGTDARIALGVAPESKIIFYRGVPPDRWVM